MQVKLTPTGKFIDGKEVVFIELFNQKGTYVKILNYGAIVNKFVVSNKHGRKQDIVLGFEEFDSYISEEYLAHYPYLGAVIGRYANRIKDGRFSIEDNVYQLAQNNGGNCLHGGLSGFDKKVWEVVKTQESLQSAVTLRYISKDGEENFPGNLTVDLSFELTDFDELVLSYEAYTDMPTVINLTHHGYFNLNEDGGSVANHIHTMPASHYLEQDDDYAVTGKLIPVEGTHHDFRKGKVISQDWDARNGYDQSYVLDKEYGDLTLASRTTEKGSGLTLTVYTTEPVAHLYTAKYLSVKGGKDGRDYGEFGAFCVETQHHPNAVNIEDFPDTSLYPDELYTQTTIYKISL